MHRVSDCVGSSCRSPMARPPVWSSASLNSVGTPEDLISQLDTGPTCAPVNASLVPLPVLTHDSGPGRLAGSSPYGSFIRNSSPVFNGALSALRTTPPARFGEPLRPLGDLRHVDPRWRAIYHRL